MVHGVWCMVHGDIAHLCFPSPQIPGDPSTAATACTTYSLHPTPHKPTLLASYLQNNTPTGIFLHLAVATVLCLLIALTAATFAHVIGTWEKPSRPGSGKGGGGEDVLPLKAAVGRTAFTQVTRLS